MFRNNGIIAAIACAAIMGATTHGQTTQTDRPEAQHRQRVADRDMQRQDNQPRVRGQSNAAIQQSPARRRHRQEIIQPENRRLRGAHQDPSDRRRARSHHRGMQQSRRDADMRSRVNTGPRGRNNVGRADIRRGVPQRGARTRTFMGRRAIQQDGARRGPNAHRSRAQRPAHTGGRIQHGAASPKSGRQFGIGNHRANRRGIRSHGPVPRRRGG